MQDFNTRPENIFVDYEGIIKDSTPLILSQLPIHFKQGLENFIDFSKFEHLNYDNLERVSMQRTKKNILEYLAVTQFDFNKTLEELKNNYVDLYINCNRLMMCDTLAGILVNQKFLQNIYVHTPEYDKRVHYDLSGIFGKNFNKKVHYVTGDKKDVYKDLENITMYILNDVEDINILLDNNKLLYTEILIAGYGYNYTLNDEGEPVLNINIESDVIHDNIFKYATFIPHSLKLESFSQM